MYVFISVIEMKDGMIVEIFILGNIIFFHYFNFII